MKRYILIKLLISNGFTLVRHGSNHDVFQKGLKIEVLARHSDIPETTAKAIIKRNNLR